MDTRNSLLCLKEGKGSRSILCCKKYIYLFAWTPRRMSWLIETNIFSVKKYKVEKLTVMKNQSILHIRSIVISLKYNKAWEITSRIVISLNTKKEYRLCENTITDSKKIHIFPLAENRSELRNLNQRIIVHSSQNYFFCRLLNILNSIAMGNTVRWPKSKIKIASRF